MRPLVLALMIYTLTTVDAQNLVPNPSFECGEDHCYAFQVSQVADFQRYACQWWVPGGTSDVFTINHVWNEPTCYTSMPYFGTWPHVGSQRPRTGARFAGIITYSKYLSPMPGNYREYLQTELTQRLVPGERYCASMHVSRAESSFWATNNLGMLFTTYKSPYTGSSGVFYGQPQIRNTQIIADTSNWVKIGGDFIADREYLYVMIGNFSGDTETGATYINYFSGNQVYYAYYFIDDVLVERYPNDQFMVTANDLVCQGVSTVITATAGIENTTWTTLADTSRVLHTGKSYNVKLQESTAFRIKASGCGKTVIDTVVITVSTRPEIELGNDTTLCKGTTYKLDAGTGFINYEWQGASASRYQDVNAAGTYKVYAETELGCTSSDSIRIQYDDVPQINLGADTLICDPQISLTLQANAEADYYKWFNGLTFSKITVYQSGVYWIEAANHCGISRDTIRIYSSDKMFISNMVTANNDGFNDVWSIALTDFAPGQLNRDLIIPARVIIVDRWGRVIYSDEQYQNSWPGSGTAVSPGIYYYQVQQPGCVTFSGWLQVAH